MRSAVGVALLGKEVHLPWKEAKLEHLKRQRLIYLHVSKQIFSYYHGVMYVYARIFLCIHESMKGVFFQLVTRIIDYGISCPILFQRIDCMGSIYITEISKFNLDLSIGALLLAYYMSELRSKQMTILHKTVGHYLIYYTPIICLNPRFSNM